MFQEKGVRFPSLFLPDSSELTSALTTWTDDTQSRKTLFPLLLIKVKKGLCLLGSALFIWSHFHHGPAGTSVHVNLFLHPTRRTSAPLQKVRMMNATSVGFSMLQINANVRKGRVVSSGFCSVHRKSFLSWAWKNLGVCTWISASPPPIRTALLLSCMCRVRWNCVLCGLSSIQSMLTLASRYQI